MCGLCIIAAAVISGAILSVRLERVSDPVQGGGGLQAPACAGRCGSINRHLSESNQAGSGALAGVPAGGGGGPGAVLQEEQFIREWAEKDVDAALEWVMAMPAGELRQASLRSVAVVLAGRDLDAAVEWAARLPEGEERQGILLCVANEAVRKAPGRALQIALEEPIQPGWDDLIRRAVMQMAGKEPDSVMELVDGVGSDLFKDQLLSTITTVWAEADPAAAATAALRLIAPGRQQDNAVIGIVQRWAQSEPRQAGEWVEQFPAGPLKESALEAVVGLWAEKDNAGVARWLAKLPAGKIRDRAVSVYSGWLTPAFPGAALEWAETIDDEQERNRQKDFVTRICRDNELALAQERNRVQRTGGRLELQ